MIHLASSRPRATVCALLLVPWLAACAGDETLTGYGAAGRDWALTEWQGAPPPAPLTLRFPAPGRVEGTGPCNSFSAAQRAPYPWFELAEMAVTERACPDLAAEGALLQALQAATLVEVGPQTLILTAEGGGEMVFMAAPDG